jgi:acetyl-CoA acetyltransferase
VATAVIRAAVQRSGVDPDHIEGVVFAQSYANSEAPCIGRWAALNAGLPIDVPGLIRSYRRRRTGSRSVPAYPRIHARIGAANSYGSAIRLFA